MTAKDWHHDNCDTWLDGPCDCADLVEPVEADAEGHGDNCGLWVNEVCDCSLVTA
ncbi:hypothetical protein AB0383_20435 [Amycolatopsis sp. NPDC051373]|uniref:hypothetical protein n=1 Tax=Amycolatopsis sp. NPDC051373 TaxID=3155801 RepID=UPI00344B224A